MYHFCAARHSLPNHWGLAFPKHYSRTTVYHAMFPNPPPILSEITPHGYAFVCPRFREDETPPFRHPLSRSAVLPLVRYPSRMRMHSCAWRTRRTPPLVADLPRMAGSASKISRASKTSWRQPRVIPPFPPFHTWFGCTCGAAPCPCPHTPLQRAPGMPPPLGLSRLPRQMVLSRRLPCTAAAPC